MLQFIGATNEPQEQRTACIVHQACRSKSQRIGYLDPKISEEEHLSDQFPFLVSLDNNLHSRARFLMPRIQPME